MAQDISLSDDVERDSPESDMWRSTGDDPNFNVKFGFVRPAFLVMFLKSSDLLEPRLYIDRGRGYAEEDSISFRPTDMVAIIVNVGSYGVIRSLRCDPADKPCRFQFHARMFRNRERALSYIRDWSGSTNIDSVVWDVGRVPRLKFAMPRFSRPAKKDVKTYLDVMYSLAKAEEASLNEEIWLSIVVPVFNAPKRHLSDLLSSFATQGVLGAELVISDDGSTSPETLDFYRAISKTANVKLVLHHRNGGIAKATNAGLSQASGRWVTFLDHDDVIAPHALKMIGNALAENPNAEFLYTDEVVVDDNLKPLGVMLKPGYDPILLSGMNYVNHFCLYKREKIASLGFLREGFDGSQDYDLVLRYLESTKAEDVYHLPFPAYWWRRTHGSYSQRFIDKATTAARAALTQSFARQGLPVIVKPALTATLHRVDLSYGNEADWPKVSILIPSKNSFKLIERILHGVFFQTDYPNLEVIVVDNGTDDQDVLDLYKKYETKTDSFQVSMKKEQFNFARSINYGLDIATGDCVLLLNNDVEVREPDWLKEMVSCLRYKGVGIVGAKLLYPDNSLQHAGVIVGLGGLAGHWFLNKPENFGGPMNRLHVRNSVICVTGAVMLVSRQCIDAVGRFDAENFAIAYNDVDFCIRAKVAGFRSVWTPFSSLYHHESLSRGPDTYGSNRKRFEIEQENLRRLHRTDRFADQTMSPAYSKTQSTPSIVEPREIYKARAGAPKGR
ncbi:glycosyltransferase family 2 protein [Agrobacterium rosae]|uniref:glycosyltransferase family 2 protein n=1 Tax=Agrobacterium rosae TaxID=1972867 RepID=UPI003BA1C437